MTETHKSQHESKRVSRPKPQEKAMPGSSPTVEDLRHDVELTREELADTVSELASKLDVKTRTTQAMQRQYITATRHRGAIGVSALGLLVAVLIILNRRRNS